MRERRLVSTPIVAATPDSRNTGATDDWIRCAISITWHRWYSCAGAAPPGTAGVTLLVPQTAGSERVPERGAAAATLLRVPLLSPYDRSITLGAAGSHG